MTVEAPTKAKAEEPSPPALSQEERDSLAARARLIAHHRLTLSLLESEQRQYIEHLLTSRDLDPALEYRIAQDGALSEVKADDG